MQEPIERATWRDKEPRSRTKNQTMANSMACRAVTDALSRAAGKSLLKSLVYFTALSIGYDGLQAAGEGAAVSRPFALCVSNVA